MLLSNIIKEKIYLYKIKEKYCNNFKIIGLNIEVVAFGKD